VEQFGWGAVSKDHAGSSVELQLDPGEVGWGVQGQVTEQRDNERRDPAAV